jgi:hypothetical protein
MSQRLRIGGSERRSASAGGRKNKKRRRMPLLEGLLRYIELLSLTLWVGGIAFFSFVASPSIFAVLGTEGGGKVIRDIFPKWGGNRCRRPPDAFGSSGPKAHRVAACPHDRDLFVHGANPTPPDI